MITEHDLEEAIKECEGTLKPTANTCIKLASFYTILDRMRGVEPPQTPIYREGYSMSSGIQYSQSEFSQLVEAKGIEKSFSILDELMETLYVMHPKLYDSVIRKLEEL